jgi:hypothetical protein
MHNLFNIAKWSHLDFPLKFCLDLDHISMVCSKVWHCFHVLSQHQEYDRGHELIQWHVAVDRDLGAFQLVF